jgi:hypothetical protein
MMYQWQILLFPLCPLLISNNIATLFRVAPWLSGILSRLVNVRPLSWVRIPVKAYDFYLTRNTLFLISGIDETRVWKVRLHSSWFPAVLRVMFLSQKAQWNIFLIKKNKDKTIYSPDVYYFIERKCKVSCPSIYFKWRSHCFQTNFAVSNYTSAHFYNV